MRTAELCKLAENSFRDVNIAYANELSMICDKLDIDVEELISLANHHPRVNILQPGCGVGGHCIPVDPWFIVDSAPEEARLIRTAREVNDSKPDWMVNKIKQTITVYLKEHPEKQIKDVSIACYGISYKEGTNDLRNSPALKIVQKLDAIGCQLFVIDSNMLEYTEELGEIRKWLVQSDTEKISADIQCPLVWHKSKNDS